MTEMRCLNIRGLIHSLMSGYQSQHTEDVFPIWPMETCFETSHRLPFFALVASFHLITLERISDSILSHCFLERWLSFAFVVDYL